MSVSVKNKDSAVSSLTSVILIVVLTVGMTAIFVFGAMSMSENLVSGKVVAVTAEPYSNSDDRGITLTVWGGKDIGSLVSIQAIVGGYKLLIKGTEGDTITNPVVGGKYDFGVTVGNVIITDKEGRTLVTTENLDDDIIQNAEVDFVGTFNDGTTQILYTSKMTIQGSEPSEIHDNHFVRVVEYEYTGYHAGHGLLITTHNDVTIDKTSNNVIVDYELTNTKGDVYKKSDGTNIFGNTQEQSVNNYLALLNRAKESNPYLLSSTSKENAVDDELTGWVEIGYTVNGEYKTYRASNLKIPKRENVVNDPLYHGGIASASIKEVGKVSTVNLTFNKDATINGYTLAFYIISSDGTVKILRNSFNINQNDVSEYHSSDGHTVNLNIGSNGYNGIPLRDSDTIEIYISQPKSSASYFWRPVIKKTVAELKQYN